MSTTHRSGRVVAATLLLASVGLIHGAAALADEVSFSDTIPIQNTNWNETVAIPQFDPAQGTLQSVTVEITGQLEGASQVENLDPNGGTTNMLDLGAAITVDGDPGGGTVTIGTNPISSNTANLAAFDGTIDFGGPSGATFDNLSAVDTQSQTITDAGVLAAYTGTGTVSLDASAVANSFAIGGGNVAALFDTDAGAIVTVRYTFEAVPAAPAIDIEKATNGDDADAAPGPTVSVGSPVTWTYEVTNTGDVALSNVSVTDDQGVAVSCPQTTLAVSESMTCTASGTATAGQYENLGSVTGQGPAGEPVTDSDPSHYFGAVPAAPAIDIEKATNGDDADAAPGPTVSVGSPVTWTYEVTNTGDVALSNVSVTDDQGVAVSCPQTTLAVSESMTCTASGTATAGQYENLGSVTGQGPAGEPVTDSDPSHYFGAVPAAPAIDIEKATNGDDADAAPGPTVSVGSPVTWTYEVTNTGDVALSNVSVTDDQGVAVSCPQTTLAVSESMTCTASGTATAGQYENLGSVTGQGPAGEPVTDSDPSHYFGAVPAAPAIDIEKTPDSQIVASGSDVTFTIVVTNNGNVDLSNVAVSDPLAPDCDATIGDLAVGASTSYDCTLANVTDNFTNVATVTGEGPRGEPVTDEDDAVVDVVGINLVKTVDTTIATVGGTVTYTYVVTNTGTVTLTDLILTDDKVGTVSLPGSSLAAGDSMTATGTYVVTAADAASPPLVNVATVTGTDPEGNPVSATDDAEVPTLVQQAAVTTTTTAVTLPETGGSIDRASTLGVILVLFGIVLVLTATRAPALDRARRHHDS